MTLTVVSPHGDDETRTKGIEQLLEDWIESKWNIQDVPVTDVKFGQKGTNILQGGKPITLRCWTYFAPTARMDIGGQRWVKSAAVQVDVWVMNNNTSLAGREPRAIKILTFLNDIFMINQGNIEKGIFQVDEIINGHISEDPYKNNLTHVIFQLRLNYIWDIVDV